MSLKDTIKKKPLTAEEIEKATEDIHRKDSTYSSEGKEKGKHRLTLDLPIWLVEKMKIDTEHTGQTLKGIVLQLLLNKYK